MKLSKTSLCQIVTARLLASATLAVAAIAITAGSANADWSNFWHQFHIDTHRNNAWPDPFNEADARDVVAPFEVMKQNGWKLHNTIGHELFREGDGVLMASGTQRRSLDRNASPSEQTINLCVEMDGRNWKPKHVWHRFVKPLLA